MANHSIRFLLMALLALGAQLLLTWMLSKAARRSGARRGPLALVVLASGVLLAWLLYRHLPEQLPICTAGLPTYLQCLGL
ncbi:hypothetical protein [Noviherbaspirillum soli]|uniref:hypothetical protein n=1 Tax=Noviherbaspirillum soli TaxID=1064518 RepID=UPI00188DB0FB|nr:hypothetical protein [Noviherbaspirillum soli]